MIVCIAEKPSVARDIAQILGATTKHSGYLEGNGYQVTWTFGHLCTLKEPNDYTDRWKSWSLGSLPMLPARFGVKLIEQESSERQFHVIESLMQKADSIINCGDAGQEGEVIQRWVMLKANVKCPVKRLWISSLTEEAIREGFADLKDQSDYQSLYEAGLSRAIGDWLLGMNATRLYTIKYGQNRQVLSIGRVQTPTLALIVQRQYDIEHFVSEPFWELKTIYRGVNFNATKGRFTSKEEGESFLTEVADKPFEVTSVKEKKGKEYAPKLFDLTSLQVECNKKFGYSADETLKLIQSLYEKKLTTYPRVDTTFLTDDIYPKCPKILASLGEEYASYTAFLKGKKLPKSKRYFDSKKVTDHHAIIPTGMPVRGLSDMETRVYDLIALRFIAIFFPDCQISTTTVMGKVASVPFKTTGKQILDSGWHDVFSKETTNLPPSMEDEKEEGDSKDQADASTLPPFVKGESGPHIPSLIEKATQPSKAYTEATLLRAMETAGKLVADDDLSDALKENGIGRPSTRANIIETLFKRHYIRKERKNLIATPTGVELIGLIREDLLKSAELTGLWESKLRKIERKEYNAGQFIDELKVMITEIVNTVLADNENRRVTTLAPEEEATKEKKKTTRKKAPKKAVSVEKVQEGAICPKCGKGKVIRGNRAYGCSEWKAGCDWTQPL
ncbi:MAG: DNA topoisomerase 3 [Bacteroidaceae bacterium]